MKFSLFTFESARQRATGLNESQAPVRMGADMRPPLATNGQAVRTVTPEDMLAYREAQEVIQNLKRSYDAGRVDGYTADFKQTYSSANSEMVVDKYKVRARTRTLAKDTPQGKAVVRTLQNNVVGPRPFKLEMKYGVYDGEGNFTEAKEINQIIEKGWREFCRKKNFTIRKNMGMMEALRVVEGSLVTAGSVLCRLHRDFPFNDFGFAVDFLEEDRLQETFMGRSQRGDRFGEGNPIRFSIEVHPQWNFPLAYWILTRHPGDVINPMGPLATAGNYGGGGSSAWNKWREQVPATDIVHFNNLRERPEQDVGMTELDATTLPLWRIQQFKKAHTISSIVAASKPHWLERKLPTGMPALPDGMTEQYANTPGWTGPQAPVAGEGGVANDPSQQQQGVGTPVQRVKPGARETLPAGFELKESNTVFPLEGAHELNEDNLRDIAVATGPSYQHISGDFQNLGFIAGLMCMIPFQDTCEVRQENLIDGGIDRIFAEWLRSCILVGYFEKRGVYVPMGILADLLEAAHFKGRRWPFVNPLVQAQALILLNEAGHLTRQQVQDALPNGVSFEKLVQALKKEKQELEAQGLTYDDIDVTRPTVGKGEPGQVDAVPNAGGAAQPPAKSKVANPVREGPAKLYRSGEILASMGIDVGKLLAMSEAMEQPA